MSSKFLQWRHAICKIFADLYSKTSGKSYLYVISLIPLLDSLFKPHRLWPQNPSSMLLNPVSAELALVIILCPSWHLLSLWLLDSPWLSYLLIPSSPSPLRLPSTHQPLALGLHQHSPLFFSPTQPLGDHPASRHSIPRVCGKLPNLHLWPRCRFPSLLNSRIVTPICVPTYYLHVDV